MKCGICSGDPARRRAIDKALAGGSTPNAVEKELKALGFVVKGETVRKHHRVCLAANGERTPSEAMLAARAAATGDSGDFAALVKAEATRLMAEGKLRVTTQDGLQAQGLLDRREEKRQDRSLITQLGLLLAGARPPAEIIEGEYAEIIEGVDIRLLETG